MPHGASMLRRQWRGHRHTGSSLRQQAPGRLVKSPPSHSSSSSSRRAAQAISTRQNDCRCRAVHRAPHHPARHEPCGRRALLQALGLMAGAAAAAPFFAAAAAAPAPTTPATTPPSGAAGGGGGSGSLLERLVTPGDVFQPGPAAPWDPKQLYYPRWMFGEWVVASRFAAFRAPLGPQLVDQGLLAASRAPPEQGGPGSTYQFTQRWYSTLPDTLENQLRVNLGLLPTDAIIADTSFNTAAATNAYLEYPAVQSVQYDPRSDPGRATLLFSTLAPGGRTLPPRRAELYINRLRSEESVDPATGVPTFATSSANRQVLLGVRQVDVTDYEVMTAYTLLGDGSVSCRQRTAVYLDPRQPGYFKAGGRAVAVYDYELQMRRAPPPPDAPPGAAACVATPKDVVQCV